MEDPDGAKYNIKLEGNVTREKILKIFEMMDLMNIENNTNASTSTNPQNLGTTGAKIWHIVEKYFPLGKFTSANILEKYEDDYNKPIKLSIISTYLSRFADKGKVNRLKLGREWTYQVVREAVPRSLVSPSSAIIPTTTTTRSN